MRGLRRRHAALVTRLHSGRAAEVLEHLGFHTAAPGPPSAAIVDRPELSGRCQRISCWLPIRWIPEIHQSIGHPIELDRILGDERNYAGTSFVTPDMFGTYRYGSPLLNLTFDPTPARRAGEL